MKVIIAGGGTAGHINPGLAIAKKIVEKNKDAKIIFIGTERGMETKLVPREGFELQLIRVRGFRRKLSVDTLKSVRDLLLGIMDARRIIKKEKPDIVIGTGGYVCGPVLYQAAMMKIPTLIHEQNAFPGVTNKILSRYVDKVAISFKEAEKYFKTPKKLVLTGNPVRRELIDVDRSKNAKRADKSVLGNVVIVGGSLGAQRINDTVTDMLKNFYNEDFSLIFATGSNRYDNIKKELKDYKFNNAEVVPYIYDAASTYGNADLIVCRAGAITSSEMTAMGIPCIMIPSPNVTANHQEYNARALEKQGASVVILEKELSAQVLYEQIKKLLTDSDYLTKMSRNSKKMGITDASDKIYSIIAELLKK